jgi:hypothetical protein
MAISPAQAQFAARKILKASRRVLLLVLPIQILTFGHRSYSLGIGGKAKDGFLNTTAHHGPTSLCQ